MPFQANEFRFLRRCFFVDHVSIFYRQLCSAFLVELFGIRGLRTKLYGGHCQAAIAAAVCKATVAHKAIEAYHFMMRSFIFAH